MLKRAVSIFAWIVVFELIAFGIGELTRSNITDWYLTLQHSRLNPPALVFPIVWTILYAILAVAIYLIWERRNQAGATVILNCLALQMLLNWSWSPLFFIFHQLGWSLICILAMIILLVATLFLSRNRYKLSSMMLIPYLLWLCFAAYLNAVIWILNGPGG